MPRSGPGVYTLPATYLAVDGELATASQHNDPLEDLQTDANTVRPIVAGGSGQDTAVEALDAFTVKGSNIASATTTNLATATGRLVHITGTTTITGFSTANAGVERELIFDGILTLTHNGTSLILPGNANILTEANDTAIMVSEGSGNWRCINYQRAAALVPTITSGTWTPTVTLGGNAQASTPAANYYLRVGDRVYCFGSISIDPTAGSTGTTIDMSLPIASDLGALSDLAGTSASGQEVGRIIANAATNTAQLTYTSVGTAATTHGFSFGYRII